MPKALKNINMKMLEKFRAKVAKIINISFNCNKNYNKISEFIYEQTHTQISSSTLRRVFQYNSNHIPTKSTLDLISQSIGYVNWDDFIEKEEGYAAYDLSQLISAIQLGGISGDEEAKIQISKFINHPNVFDLLDVIVNDAIKKHDIKLLSQLFDFPDIFTLEQDPLKIYFFVHNLVLKLNKGGLMTLLIPFYGASTKAQVFLVEWYVDEDNLDGYYYDLLQEYHKYKTNQEAMLFYDCLMYQHALQRNEPTYHWLDSIKGFVASEPVHPIPKARRLAIILLESDSKNPLSDSLKREISHFFQNLNDFDKIMTSFIILRFLYIGKRISLMVYILKFIPDLNEMENDIWTRININQLKIYLAFSFFSTNQRDLAIKKLQEFEPFLINNFIRNIIISDYDSILKLIDKR